MQLDFEKIGQEYGNIIFDLCEAMIQGSSHTQAAYRLIINEIARKLKGPRFVEYEREWIISIVIQQLRTLFSKQGRHLTSEEQIQLDGTRDIPSRLKKFDLFVLRLNFDERLVLLLKDKLGLSYTEIATCTGWPIDSVKLRRTQVLRTLEDSIWGTS